MYLAHYSKWAIDMGLVVSNVAHLAMATHEEKERTIKLHLGRSSLGPIDRRVVTISLSYEAISTLLLQLGLRMECALDTCYGDHTREKSAALPRQLADKPLEQRYQVVSMVIPSDKSSAYWV